MPLNGHNGQIYGAEINAVLLLVCLPFFGVLGVIHNCHHFHERTQRTLGGEGVKGERTLF